MNRKVTAALVGIVLLAAAVRLWGINFGLPHTQARPDETIIIDVARGFLRRQFSAQFYDYPWLQMWTLSGLYLCYYVWGVATGAFHSIADLLASWPVNWAPFFLLSRALAAVMGTATVVVVFRIGRRLWGNATGLVAAFFLSIAFLHVRDSHYGTTDVPMTFLIMLSVAFLIEAHLDRKLSRFALAGALGGLAAATKYNALIVPIVMVVSQLLHALESPNHRLQAVFDRRLLWFGLPFGLAFLIGVPFVVIDAHRFLISMRALQDSMVVGTPGLALGNGWVHHLEFSLRYGVGLPFLLAGVTGAAVLLVNEAEVGMLLLSFPVAYYVIAGAIRNLFFRYAIPIVPFLCLTAAYLVCLAAKRLVAAARPWQLAALTTAAAVAIAAPSIQSVVEFDRVMNQSDNRVVIARWFEQHVPPGSSILQSGSHYGHAQFDQKLGYTSWRWEGGQGIFFVGNHPAKGRPDWILVQDSPLPSETQAIVKQFLTEDYVLVHEFHALSLDVPHVYDRQDAFFVPFAGFDQVTRPGPNFSLFKRAHAPAL